MGRGWWQGPEIPPHRRAAGWGSLAIGLEPAPCPALGPGECRRDRLDPQEKAGLPIAVGGISVIRAVSHSCILLGAGDGIIRLRCSHLYSFWRNGLPKMLTLLLGRHFLKEKEANPSWIITSYFSAAPFKEKGSQSGILSGLACVSSPPCLHSSVPGPSKRIQQGPASENL